MASTAARLLRLLSLLQGGRSWSGVALAERLDVHPRSLRRDIERLREAGYPVHATPGSGGGYRLGQSAAALPLLLEEDEALTVAVALRAAASAVRGMDAAATSVMAKLAPLLARRSGRRASAAHAAMAGMPAAETESLVDAGLLAQLAAACRDRTALRLDYRRHSGPAITRTVEPALRVNYGRRWYLLVWDCERQDWRSLRADRIDQAVALPGQRLHLDIKKLARFRQPGHRVTGNRQVTSDGTGWEYVHPAIDDHSRLAFGSIEPDERGSSACRALLPTVRYYRRLGVQFERVLTDNGACYRSRSFRRLVRRLGMRHLRTRPYTPRTNGKAERLVQTSLREWAYARSYANSEERAHALQGWLHHYNWHRPHAGLGDRPPITRIPLNNVVGLHS